MNRSQRRAHIAAWVLVPLVAIGLIAWGVALSGPVTALDQGAGGAVDREGSE